MDVFEILCVTLVHQNISLDLCLTYICLFIHYDNSARAKNLYCIILRKQPLIQ